jgi:hypothetical protein
MDSVQHNIGLTIQPLSDGFRGLHLTIHIYLLNIEIWKTRELTSTTRMRLWRVLRRYKVTLPSSYGKEHAFCRTRRSE